MDEFRFYFRRRKGSHTYWNHRFAGMCGSAIRDLLVHFSLKLKVDSEAEDDEIHNTEYSNLKCI